MADLAQAQEKEDANGELRVVMTEGKGSKEEAADFANYCSYASLHHQRVMLTDHSRMHAYHSAIMNNAEVFKGKTVLDVGTGSGILAIWCALAGAKKVYAVEYTDMAKLATKLVAANMVNETVEVIQSSVEDLELPGKVDIIISEWMGYLLLRESMLDSVVRARDRWLKPDGLMFPSKTTIYWGLISDEEERLRQQGEYINAMQDWFKFKDETKRFYQVDMGCLEDIYEKEQKEWYIHSCLWTELHPGQVVSQPLSVMALDMHTCTMEDVQGMTETPFSFAVDSTEKVSAFAGWFTADFDGREGSPFPNPITLTTAPENGYTHWGQQVMYLEHPATCEAGTRIEGSVKMVRNKENIRLYDVIVQHSVKPPTDSKRHTKPSALIASSLPRLLCSLAALSPSLSARIRCR
ncbi:unnamed protein product [Chrysoparadoxa australica]